MVIWFVSTAGLSICRSCDPPTLSAAALPRMAMVNKYAYNLQQSLCYCCSLVLSNRSSSNSALRRDVSLPFYRLNNQIDSKFVRNKLKWNTIWHRVGKQLLGVNYPGLIGV